MSKIVAISGWDPNGYDRSSFPQGVENPFVPAVIPYPSNLHGSQWTYTRDGGRLMPAPYNVLGFLKPKGDGPFTQEELDAADALGKRAAKVAALAGLTCIVVGASFALRSKKWGDSKGQRMGTGAIAGAVLGIPVSFAAAVVVVARHKKELP